MRDGEAAGDALDVGEDAVAALAVQAIEGMAEVGLVVGAAETRIRFHGRHRDDRVHRGHPIHGHRSLLAGSGRAEAVHGLLGKFIVDRTLIGCGPRRRLTSREEVGAV